MYITFRIMGNCVEAFKAQKKKKINKTVGGMITSVKSQVALYKLKQEDHAGRARNYQSQLDRAKDALKGKPPNKEQRKLMLALIRRRTMCERENGKYGTAETEAEAALVELERMDINTILLDQKEALTNGYKELKTLGLHTTGAEKKVDSEAETLEDISDFNRAFVADAAPSFTEEDEETFAAELDDEFNASAMTLAPPVPGLKKPQKTVKFVKAEEPELKIENLVLETD